MRKIYGYYRKDVCPFCGRMGVTKNKQGVPVCQKHKDKEFKDLKCACGEWLDVCSGKYGAYFRCMRCGNISFQKGLEMNPQIKEKKKEITINSDQVDTVY